VSNERSVTSPVVTECHTREVGKGASISGDNGPARVEGSSGDQEVMRTSGTALAANGNEQLCVSQGHANVIVDDGDDSDDVVDKG
jgi:hypothetical protein